jgi:AcrR family transcriptional regulator
VFHKRIGCGSSPYSAGIILAVDSDLYAATVAVLRDVGWDGLTLDRVAERAGRARVTLWRNGITRESLQRGLLQRLADDYRDAMLPVLTAEWTPRERLERTMLALCDVVDEHSNVLSYSDEMFHRAYQEGNVPLPFLAPFIRALRDAETAGELRSSAAADDITDTADVLFNSVAWTYLHLRTRHEWPPEKARRLLLDTLLDGILV